MVEHLPTRLKAHVHTHTDTHTQIHTCTHTQRCWDLNQLEVTPLMQRGSKTPVARFSDQQKSEIEF
jgi:hypothetical protein